MHDDGWTAELTGAEAVAGQVLGFRRFAESAQPALIDGVVGLVGLVEGRPVAAMGFTIVDGNVVGIDVLADPERLAQLELTILGETGEAEA